MKQNIIRNRKKYITNIGIYGFLTLWAITTIYPFVWIILNSFKQKDSILTNSFGLPNSTTFTLNNYKDALFGKYNLFQAYANSLIISLSVVAGVLLISVLASFVMARYEFRGKKIFYFLMVACMMFPIFSIIFPLLKFLTRMDLMNNYLGVILPQIAGNIAFTTILLTGFIKQLPLEIEESAYLEGANIFQVIFRLIIPMSKSSFATASIFVFLWSYNDLFLQMLVITDKKLMPISALLREISSKEGGTNQGLMVASVAIIAIPILVVYVILQKHIIKGLTAGAVKG